MRTSRDDDRFTVSVFGAGPVPDRDTLAKVAGKIGGYTLALGSGGWIDSEAGGRFALPGGRLVVEPSWSVTMFGTPDGLQGAADLLAAWAIGHGESEVCATWTPCSVVHYMKEG